MKIAVPVTENNEIDDHFGHCEFYTIYTVLNTNAIVAIESMKANHGCGCKSNIATILADHGIKVMLVNTIGSGAINKLNEAGINVIKGCTGNPTDNVKLFLQRLLIDGGTICNDRQQHREHGHECSH